MISLATLGKFTGAPTRKSVLKFTGGDGGGSKPHKFPAIRVHRIEKEYINIDMKAELIEDKND